MSRIVKRLSVPADLAGRRLDQAAAALLPEFSRSRLRDLDRRRRADGRRPRSEGPPAAQGRRGARARRRARGGRRAGPEPIPLDVVHADDALLVIDKPVGLVVHPGAGNRSGTLQNALLHRYPELALLPRAGLVHRLDKDTSGLLLVARTLHEPHGARRRRSSGARSSARIAPSAKAC